MIINQDAKKSYGNLYLPFTLEEIEIIRPLVENCYAYVRLVKENNCKKNETKEFNIDIIDEQSNLLVKISNLIFKSFYISNKYNENVVDNIYKLKNILNILNI
jgi:hypothetical protein